MNGEDARTNHSIDGILGEFLMEMATAVFVLFNSSFHDVSIFDVFRIRCPNASS